MADGNKKEAITFWSNVKKKKCPNPYPSLYDALFFPTTSKTLVYNTMSEQFRSLISGLLCVSQQLTLGPSRDTSWRLCGYFQEISQLLLALPNIIEA
jgi:hypothetical protein